MKIKSNFHDYYDIALKHGMDDVLFVRKRKEIPIKDIKFHLPEFGFLHGPELEFSRGNLKKNEIKYFYSEGVIFCGKFYPIIWSALSKEGYYLFGEDKFFCPEKQFMALKTKYSYGLIPRTQNRIRELSYVNFTDLHRELGSPIIWVGLYPGKRVVGREETVIINPTLRKIEFQKVKDPYTAFQDIDYFISNFMGRMPEMVVLSNDDRLEKHGFDKKTSFRKDKTKKKS